MNKKEAIFILNRIEEEFRKEHLDSEADAMALAIYTMGTVDELRKQRDAVMAQQTCGDTISRQAAIDCMMRLQREDEEAYGASIPEGFDGERAAEALRQLPSAQPERKTGRWMEYKKPYDVDGEYYCYCSECGCDAHEHHLYCPNCGSYNGGGA